MLSPKETGLFVSSRSLDVKVNNDGVKKLAEELFAISKKNIYNLKSWKEDHELYPKSMDEESIKWILLTTGMNFSFWADDEKNKPVVIYKGKEYTGYLAMCAAVNRAIDEGVRILDPKFYHTITLEQLSNILRTDRGPPIPLLEQRVEVLHETADVLIKKFGGSFVNCIKECNQSAQALLELVITEFPSYRDTATYEGTEVAIYKRAQILIADIWANFEGQGLGTFHDIDRLTMFADYRIPQALHYFGALQYSPKLLKELEKGDAMKSGEKLEVEIRACSIHAVELVAQKMKKLAEAEDHKAVTYNSVMIDHYLWDYRRMHAEKITVPMHKVRCIYY